MYLGTILLSLVALTPTAEMGEIYLYIDTIYSTLLVYGYAPNPFLKVNLTVRQVESCTDITEKRLHIPRCNELLIHSVMQLHFICSYCKLFSTYNMQSSFLSSPTHLPTYQYSTAMSKPLHGRSLVETQLKIWLEIKIHLTFGLSRE